MKTLTTLVLAIFLTLGCSATGQVQANDDYFTQAELDSMLAPVALYPDSVLSHVLIAATYPLEVIQAARFSREHPGLRGEDAVDAVEHRNWDPSVKALVAFPELLRRMDEDLQWTQNLGDAFLIQEEDVIASIQYLRSEAYSQGHLRSNDRVKVVREREYIYIEPARTRVVYVPYYDPRVIYTNWRWSSYRPHYWHRPSGFSVSVNFHWGRPYHIRPSFYFSSFHWPTRRVVVVNHHHHYHKHYHFRSGRDVARFEDARHWRHDPQHRRGVAYRGRIEKARFVDSSRPASARVESRQSRALARTEKREWATQRRSGTDFDRRSQSRSRDESPGSTSSRSKRVAELRDRNRGDSRAVTRGGSDERLSSSLRSNRADSSAEPSRSVTGRAPARSESRSRASVETRSSAGRASRVTESLRSGSSSRSAASSRARGSSQGTTLSTGRTSRATSDRGARSGSTRSSISVPRDLTVRSSTGRERASVPSRSGNSRSAASTRGGSISRSSAPSRQSAPSRSRSSGRESAPTRSAPRTRASAPNRSSKSAPSRSSRSASTRSSRSSTSGRSRGGDSRRGGGRGDERR